MHRARSALACLLLAASWAGCASPDAKSAGGGPDCPETPLAAGAASGHLVSVYLGSEVGRATCVHLLLDGQAILVKRLDAAEPTGEYQKVGTLTWAGDSVQATATESGAGHSAAERLTLGDQNHLVVSVFAGSLRIQNQPNEPVFG
ncbi:MAG: hypothetical protein QOI63_2020 [Thermoplasmata archaeon]|jgi:hypothetical protein|nr:hypothetical protein [Thermoplasmata archaeon]